MVNCISSEKTNTGNEFPSAALKGFTWGEYEKDRKDGYQQLSLFDEESPFQ